MGLIENISILLIVYTDIYSCMVWIYSRSFRSFRIHGASSPCCVLVFVFIRKNVYFNYFLSPILGPLGWGKTRNRNDGMAERNGKAERNGDKTRNGDKINDNIRHVILFDITKHAQKLHHIYLTNQFL